MTRSLSTMFGVAAILASAALAASVANSIHASHTPAYALQPWLRGWGGELLLDRKTGRVWMPACMGNAGADQSCDGPLYWQEMYVEGVTPARAPAAQQAHQRDKTLP